MESFISAQEQAILEKACKSSTSQQRLVERSRVILLYNQHPNKSGLSRSLTLPRTYVARWVSRWQQHALARKSLEQEWQQGLISGTKYSRALLALLSDEPRS